MPNPHLNSLDAHTRSLTMHIVGCVWSYIPVRFSVRTVARPLVHMPGEGEGEGELRSHHACIIRTRAAMLAPAACEYLVLELYWVQAQMLG